MIEYFDYPFFVNALWGVVLISVASAIVGTYIVARRMVAICGGITHACFGGLGLGCFMGWNPLAVAAAFAVGSSLGVEWLSERQRLRQDSAIAVVWSLGMALGVLFVFLTPGYVPELNSFLFGNILTVTRTDLWLFGGFTAVLASFFALNYRRIVAVAFDPDFARVAGLPVRLLQGVMSVLVAVCIVLAIRLVGVMLLMAVISLPQLTAEVACRRFGSIMAGSVAVSLVCSVAGLFLSMAVDVPCSALIVMFMGAAFAVARCCRKMIKRPQADGN